MKGKLLSDGSIEGQSFSGDKYKGEYPSPKEGEETYEEYYKRVEKCKSQGFHLGDLSWDHWDTYLLGCPGGRGQHVQNYTIGNVPDYAWVKDEEPNSDD